MTYEELSDALFRYSMIQSVYVPFLNHIDFTMSDANPTAITVTVENFSVNLDNASNDVLETGRELVLTRYNDAIARLNQLGVDLPDTLYTPPTLAATPPDQPDDGTDPQNG